MQRFKPVKLEITNIKYYEHKANPKYKKSIDTWSCRIKGFEPRKGNAKCYHKGLIYLTKEQFDNKIFETHDRIILNDKVEWKTRTIDYVSYDKKKIKQMLKDDYQKNNVKMTEITLRDGTTKTIQQFKEQEYCITFLAKIGQAALFESKENSCFISINGNAQIFIDNKEIKSNKFAMYIDEKQVELLKDYNNQIVNASIYYHKQLKRKFTPLLLIDFDNDTNQYYINLVSSEEE